jgi:hypothetical protein
MPGSTTAVKGRDGRAPARLSQAYAEPIAGLLDRELPSCQDGRHSFCPELLAMRQERRQTGVRWRPPRILDEDGMRIASMIVTTHLVRIALGRPREIPEPTSARVEGCDSLAQSLHERATFPQAALLGFQQ